MANRPQFEITCIAVTWRNCASSSTQGRGIRAIVPVTSD
jgi:hypothetical protein